MTVKQVCKYLGISRATLYRRMAIGAIRPLPANPALERPKEVLFSADEIERFKNQNVSRER